MHTNLLTLQKGLYYTTIFCLACCSILTNVSCVKKKLYKTELSNRQLAEAREKVLYAELTDRKAEAARMVINIGDLNKTVGRQESEIAELRGRIVQLSTNANKTTTSLLDEKAALEKTLNEKTAILKEKENELAKIKAAETAFNNKLSDLSKLLSTKLSAAEGITVTIVEHHVVLTLPDKLLFEPTGVNISTTGKTTLDSLAKILIEQPGLPAQIITYTDNQLPKNNKTLTDTWDWSLRRASTVARTLITDYGVNANQLSPTGRGEFFPVATNETSEGRLQNRRTEIVFF